MMSFFSYKTESKKGYIEMRDHFYCEINMKCARQLHFTLLNLPFYQNLMYQHLKNFISQTFLHNWTNLVKLLFCFYFVLMVLENNLFYITISFLLIQKSNKLSQPFHLINNLSPNYFYLKLFLICLLQLFFLQNFPTIFSPLTPSTYAHSALRN